MRHHSITSRLAAVVLGTILCGTACAGGDPGELGTVEQIVVSEATGADGVTERVIVTTGSPAELDLEPVDTAAALVAPWEYDPGEHCTGPNVPTPTAEHGRDIAHQDGVHVAYVVAEYQTADDAHNAQSALLCYHRSITELAERLGRSPGTTPLESRQEMAVDSGVQLETRITPPWFDEPGPVVFSARIGTVVTFLIDLDNGLDGFDGPSLATQLAGSAG